MLAGLHVRLWHRLLWLVWRSHRSQECTICGFNFCPYREPLHFHHDGCPSCWSAEQEIERIFCFTRLTPGFMYGHVYEPEVMSIAYPTGYETRSYLHCLRCGIHRRTPWNWRTR